ncbi:MULTISPECIES: C39 family peptidase [unclassified Microcoleus]|uniref:C39 family peptidase n=1 Tax=unclassified Microcoleus TaxID=2642155 RepID=UPI0025EB9696|nr:MULTISPECIES: C39 family peptidase [unclassified Microcoleus]
MSYPFTPDDRQNLLASANPPIPGLNDTLEANKGIIPQLDPNRFLRGGASQEANITTLTPDNNENFILSNAPLPFQTTDFSLADVSTIATAPSVDSLTGEAMPKVYEELKNFATDPDFTAKMNEAFGDSWDTEKAKALTQEWIGDDFSGIPQVKVISESEINGANGAFAAATDTIYLSKEFLDRNVGNPTAIVDVLLEEIGHSVDSHLNITDSPGDEGAIFAAVVQGKELSQGELQDLKGEDDRSSVVIDGHQYLVEKQLSSFPIQGSIGSFYNRNPAIASQLGKATSAEYQFVYSKWRQNFQNGAIFHSANGTFSVRGSLGNNYLNLGGQNSQLGLPTSEESHLGNGNWRQNFEKGTLDWLNNGTAKVTLYSGNNSQLPTSIQQADPFFKLQYLNAKYNPNGPNGSNNCGPASLAMILKMLGKEPANISVETSIDYARAQMFGYSNSVKQGLNVLDLDRQSTNWDQIKAGITKTGGKPEDLQGWDQLDQSLNQGKPVISWGFLRPEWRQQFPQRVGDGYTPHLNAILGKTTDGKYIVADPMHQGGPVAMTKQQLSVFYWQPDRGSYQPVFIAFGKK